MFLLMVFIVIDGRRRRRRRRRRCRQRRPPHCRTFAKKVFLKKYFFRDRRDFLTKVDLLDCCQVGTWSRLRSELLPGILLCHDLNEILSGNSLVW